ncbi:hypothetical protein MLD38_026336 [Melastoma candidum]|uniref:Uncharacterized protein n=1 Tax=Melastoma candidum TaxID=119954 RepID=A0ACB9NY21_9MYRT|nr:hypothetical protein MLD38_026336 [Melastoma candidum]
MWNGWLTSGGRAQLTEWGRRWVRSEKDLLLPSLTCLFGGVTSGAPSAFNAGTPSRPSHFSPSISVTFSWALCVSSSSDRVAGATSSSPSLDGDKERISLEEVRRLMRLVNVASLKTRLGMHGKEVVGYNELLDECQALGIARNRDEAVEFARVLDEAGVVLHFRDKIYLHPDKVVELVRRAVPIELTAEDDPIRDELKVLQEKKEEIDVMAHKQVRRILFVGLGLSVSLIMLFFRLTFWEFSWDVMEPIAFFVTMTGVVIGYAYFLYTSRDPTYQDLLKRIFLSRQRKLIRRYNFDVDRFMELQKKCQCRFDACTSIKKRIGIDLDLEDAIHDK